MHDNRTYRETTFQDGHRVSYRLFGPTGLVREVKLEYGQVKETETEIENTTLGYDNDGKMLFTTRLKKESKGKTSRTSVSVAGESTRTVLKLHDKDGSLLSHKETTVHVSGRKMRELEIEYDPKSSTQEINERFFDDQGNLVWVKSESNIVNFSSGNHQEFLIGWWKDVAVSREKVVTPMAWTFASRKYVEPGAKWTGSDGAEYKVVSEGDKVFLTRQSQKREEHSHIAFYDFKLGLNGLHPHGTFSYKAHVYDPYGPDRGQPKGSIDYHAEFNQGVVTSIHQRSLLNSVVLEGDRWIVDTPK